MSLFAGRLGIEKRLDQLPRDFGAGGSAAQADDVQMIVLDTLACGKVILNQRRSDSGDLVRADRSTDAASAEGDPAFHVSTRDGTGEGNDVVGIVVTVIEAAIAEVNDFISRGTEVCDKRVLQEEPAMIGGNADKSGPWLFHVNSPSGLNRSYRGSRMRGRAAVVAGAGSSGVGNDPCRQVHVDDFAFDHGSWLQVFHHFACAGTKAAVSKQRARASVVGSGAHPELFDADRLQFRDGQVD